jgi:two-component system sensor histidine kinase YesM
MIALKYRTKLLIFSAIITLIPIIGIGTFFIARISSAILEQSKQETINQVDFIGENLEYAIGVVESLSDAIYLNEPLQRSLLETYDNQGDSADVYTDYIYPIIRQNKTIQNSLINELSIYITNEDFLKNGQEIKYADEEVRRQDWYKEVVSTSIDGYRMWSDKPNGDLYQGEFAKYYLPYYRKLNNYAGKLSGVLKIELKEEYFYNQFFKDISEKKMYILNPSLSIISSNIRGAIGESGSTVLPFLKQLVDTQGVVLYNVKNEDFTVVYKRVKMASSIDDWYIISVVPNTLLLEKVKEARNIGIMMCFGLMLIVSMVILVFSKSFTGRLNQLESSTRAVVEGDYTALVEVSGSDEISNLSNNFNTMLKHLNKLINEVVENELQMRKSKIKQHETEFIALQNQINPHFIYNTLDAIRMNAILADDYSVADLLVSLSRLLRYNISKSGTYVTFEEEINYVKDYIALMNTRYVAEISLHIDIDESLKNEKILRLILQPIIENSIKYGFAKRTQGQISIVARMVNDDIIVKAKDDGLGIEPERIMDLNNALDSEDASSEKNSIGLENVNQRLKLRFGMGYGLSIESILNEGTTVNLRMACIREEVHNA